MSPTYVWSQTYHAGTSENLPISMQPFSKKSYMAASLSHLTIDR